MASDIVLPRRMMIGPGASGQLAEMLEQFGVCSPLIVTDAEIVRLGYLERITRNLDAKGISYSVYDQVVADPTVSSIEAGVEAYKQNPKHDCIVGLGGGEPY